MTEVISALYTDVIPIALDGGSEASVICEILGQYKIS